MSTLRRDVSGSPLSRHSVSTGLHYLVFAAHDVSSIAALVLFPLSFTFGFRHTAALPLGVSVVTGWWLIGYRLRQRTAKGHLTLTQIVTTCIVNQGLAVMLLGSLLMVPRPVGQPYLAISAVIALHAAYCAMRCLGLYMAEARENPRNRFAETTLQLAYLVAAPNTVLFSALALGLAPTNNRGFVSLCLLFECLPGILFSIAHDKRWLWRPGGLEPWQRHGICMLSYVCLALACWFV